MTTRAHIATFPPRRDTMLQAVQSLSRQVDRIYICLNEYTEIPAELAGINGVEAVIPDTDLKDVGKFFFDADPDDIVFTCDDDILYPPDYVAHSLRLAAQMDMDRDIIGYQANALVYKKQKAAKDWRNYMFFKRVNNIIKVDILGTGTACMLGKNLPDLADVQHAAGFVDLAFSAWQTAAGRMLWTLPRGDDFIKRNLPQGLEATSLFNTVARKQPPAVRAAQQHLISTRTKGSGETKAKLDRQP